VHEGRKAGARNSRNGRVHTTSLLETTSTPSLTFPNCPWPIVSPTLYELSMRHSGWDSSRVLVILVVSRTDEGAGEWEASTVDEGVRSALSWAKFDGEREAAGQDIWALEGG